MEDFERDLEKELKSYAVSGDARNASKWNMILVDQYGGMRHVPKFKGVVYFFVFILLAALISGSVFAGLYFQQIGSVRSLDQKLKRVMEDNAVMQGEMDLLMARIAIAESTKKSVVSKEAPVKKARKVKPGKQAIKKSSEPEIEKPKAQLTIDDTGKASKKNENLTDLHMDSSKVSEKIDVDNLSVTEGAAGRYFNLSFIVRNISKGDKKVEGRIFVMLQPEKSASNNIQMVPFVTLHDGLPDSLNNGLYFSIARFKKVQLRVDSQLQHDLYKNATIFVYNTKGSMVFKKTVSIN